MIVLWSWTDMCMWCVHEMCVIPRKFIYLNLFNQKLIFYSKYLLWIFLTAVVCFNKWKTFKKVHFYVIQLLSAAILFQAYEFPGPYPRICLFQLTSRCHSTFADPGAARIFPGLECVHNWQTGTWGNVPEIFELLSKNGS